MHFIKHTHYIHAHAYCKQFRHNCFFLSLVEEILICYNVHVYFTDIIDILDVYFNQGYFTSIFWHEFVLYTCTLDYSFSLTVMPIYQCLYYFIQELDTRFYFQYLVILRNLALIIMLEKPLGNVLCMIQKSIKDREKLMFNIRI